MVRIEFKGLVDNPQRPVPPVNGNGWILRTTRKYVFRPYSLTKCNTGIEIKVPKGYELLIKGVVEGLEISTAHTSIDGDDTGEVFIYLKNSNAFSKIMGAGDAMAKVVLIEVPKMEWVQVDKIGEKDMQTTIPETLETVDKSEKPLQGSDKPGEKIKEKTDVISD